MRNPIMYFSLQLRASALLLQLPTLMCMMVPMLLARTCIGNSSWSDETTCNAHCEQLIFHLTAVGLQHIVLLPNSVAYEERETSYWASDAVLSPNCIVQPRTTEEVSRVVKLLSGIDSPVALRSGGHTQWAGANDIHDGITIDLGRMTDVAYDAASNIASVDPGLRWGDVYQKLLNHNVCVADGRDGNVGIGGFLTGGGNSYYAGLYGFACDTVANFQVVLANGDVVNANQTANSDLWKALKGGSGNFGIVTRFDLIAFPAKDVWGGIRISTRSGGDALAQALIDFTNNNEKNPEAAHLLEYTFNPSTSPNVSVAHVVVDTKGLANGPAFDEILKVPAVMSDVKIRSMQNMSDSYLQPSHLRQVWFSLTFKNDVQIVKKAGEMHDELVKDLTHLMPGGNFSTQCIFQPIPALFTKHSVENGGNVMGLDGVDGNALLWLITGTSEAAKQHRVMHRKLSEFSSTLQVFAENNRFDVNWQYLNYVDNTQNPLQSYGKKNVDHIRKVAAKYDPHGMFQSKVVSGWKISGVDS